MAPETDVTVEKADEVTFETEHLAPAVNAIVEESKAGYKTTEFWVALIVSLLTVLDGIPLPEKFEGVVAGVIGAAYIISRGVAKKGIPAVTPVAVPESQEVPPVADPSA